MPADSATPVLAESVPAVKGGVFALGNFDGVHGGHRAVVKTAIDKARGLGLPARVLTFEPHPRSLFKPHIPPFRLTPAPAKVRFLRALGVDDVIVRAFTPEFSQVAARDFVQQVLIKDCGAQHVVAGFDFVFGHERGGDMASLREWLSPSNVGVTEVTPFRDGQGNVMSSTRARELLQAGDMRGAARILGRPWSIAGIIEHGERRGHELSVPTANIALGEYLRPKFGVYAVEASRVGDPTRYQGVANIGNRPTVDGTQEKLEFHLFDFYQDLYGQEWDVELIDFIRPERAFPDLEALRLQIMQDIEDAKTRLTAFVRGR
jgi:riboflavin kinase/FMN adenylyltransferase